MSRLKQTLNEIISENVCRKSTRFFDPVTGVGSPGERVEVLMNCPFLGVSTLHLPVSLLKTEVGRSVIESGGVARFAEDRGLTREAVAELFELVRLRHDFPYWASKYGLIRPKTGGDNRPLILNSAQRKLVGQLEMMRTAHKPVRAILLKARQWGGSTVIQLYMVWHQLLLGTGLNSLTIAHQNSATEEIRAMMRRVVDEYPDWLLRVDFDAAERGLREDRYDGSVAMKTVGRSGNTLSLPPRNCDFKIGTAERPDSSRGGSYSLIHLSEVGIWRATEGRKPGEIVVSATSGVLPAPATVIILESTANGMGTYFHKEYVAAKEKRAQWTPVFIAWFDIEQYALPIEDPEVFANDLYENRESDDKDDRSESGRYLWNLWESGASLEAINWYIWERRKYDSSSSMASEYPSNDVEAFSSSGYPVFPPEKLAVLARRTREPELSLFGRFRIETWEKIKPMSDYLAVLSVGGIEIGSRTTAIVVDISDTNRPEIVAQLSGTDTPRRAVSAVRRLCAAYGDCPLALVSDSSNLIESGHTLYAADILTDDYNTLYPRSKTRIVYELDDRELVVSIDSLAELIDCGRWIEPSAAAVEQLETLVADPAEGYRPISGSSLDLILPRALAARIATREL